VNQLNFLNRYLTSWYELFVDRQGQKALYEKADKHLLKKVFSRLMQAFTVFRVHEGFKRSLRNLAWSLRKRNLEFKAFKEIRKFLSIRRFKKGQERLADVQYLAKVIRAWYEKRPVIKESSERYKKSKTFRRYRLQM
jgi:hypothetical protein